MAESKTWKVIERASTVVVVVVGLLIGWQVLARTDSAPGSSGAPIPKEPINIVGAPSDGSPEAPTVMLIYSDFQCPACQRFSTEVLPTLRERYVRTGRLQLVFRYLPLPIHSNAKAAARVAECADREGRFWDMHDRLFEGDLRQTPDDLSAHVDALGIGRATFDKCVTSDDSLAAVEADLAGGLQLGVNATPTFFVARRLDPGTVRLASRIVGVRSIETFSVAIEAVR